MPTLAISVERAVEIPPPTEPLWLSIAGAVAALVILPTLFVLAMVALGVTP